MRRSRFRLSTACAGVKLYSEQRRGHLESANPLVVSGPASQEQSLRPKPCAHSHHFVPKMYLTVLVALSASDSRSQRTCARAASRTRGTQCAAPPRDVSSPMHPPQPGAFSAPSKLPEIDQAEALRLDLVARRILEMILLVSFSVLVPQKQVMSSSIAFRDRGASGPAFQQPTWPSLLSRSSTVGEETTLFGLRRISQ